MAEEWIDKRHRLVEKLRSRPHCQACQRFARPTLHSTGLYLCASCAAWSDEHGRLNAEPDKH